MGNPVLHRRYYLAKMNPCVVYVGRPCERYRQGHHVKILQFAPFFTLHIFFSLYKPDKYIQRLEHAVSVNWFRSEISFGFTKQIVMPKIVIRCKNSVKIPLHFCLFLSYECYFLFYVKEFICSIGLHTLVCQIDVQGQIIVQVGFFMEN